jgi:hypothetical protein
MSLVEMEPVCTERVHWGNKKEGSEGLCSRGLRLMAASHVGGVCGQKASKGKESGTEEQRQE